MAEQSEKTSLKQLIQGMTGGEVAIIQGKVISTAPIKVQAINDEKLIIYPNSLFIPRHLTDYQADVTISWKTESASSHAHTIQGKKTATIHNALKVGDILHLLSLNYGKQYYILDRV